MKCRSEPQTPSPCPGVVTPFNKFFFFFFFLPFLPLPDRSSKRFRRHRWLDSILNVPSSIPATCHLPLAQRATPRPNSCLPKASFPMVLRAGPDRSPSAIGVSLFLSFLRFFPLQGGPFAFPGGPTPARASVTLKDGGARSKSK